MFKPYTLKIKCKKCGKIKRIRIHQQAKAGKKYIKPLCRSCGTVKALRSRKDKRNDMGREHRELMKLAEYMEKGKYI